MKPATAEQEQTRVNHFGRNIVAYVLTAFALGGITAAAFPQTLGVDNPSCTSTSR